MLALVAVSACVYPQHHRLAELRLALHDGDVPIREAKIGYSWVWGEEACDESLTLIQADEQGFFVVPDQSGWDVGTITPIPDHGRPGFQLCVETPTRGRRYLTAFGEVKEPITMRCDLGAPQLACH
jgi:hypothetical protein